jgi:hypothetical protein
MSNGPRITAFHTEDAEIAEVAFRLTLIKYRNPGKATEIIKGIMDQTEQHTHRILGGVHGKDKEN